MPVTNVITVKRVDTGLINPAGQIPYTLRQQTGVIGGVNDIFALTVPSAADVLVYDPAILKYKNVALNGAATINTSGTLSVSIDCGTF